jgi:uncharacterized protein
VTIRVSDIIDVDVAVKGTIGAAQFYSLGGTELALLTPVGYELTISKVEDHLHIKGPVRCAVKATCARCLQEFPLSLDGDLDIELAPKTAASMTGELELKGEDLDVYYFEGDEIEVDPLVYEEVMLNVPPKPLCNDACRGLCETCGTNRNYEECRCNRSAPTLLEEKLKYFLNQ